METLNTARHIGAPYLSVVKKYSECFLSLATYTESS